MSSPTDPMEAFDVLLMGSLHPGVDVVEFLGEPNPAQLPGSWDLETPTAAVAEQDYKRRIHVKQAGGRRKRTV